MDNYISTVGFVQALFGILLFLTKRPRHLSFMFLSIWMVIIAIFQGSYLLPFEVVDYFKPGIFPIMFLTGPLLYFYVYSLTVENFKLKTIYLLHIVPYLLVSVHRSTISAVAIGSTPNLIENPYYLYNRIYYSFLIFSVFIYWFLGLKHIISHRKNIPLYFSNYSGKNTLNWLVFVLTLFLLLFIISFFTAYIKILELNVFNWTTLSFNLTVFTFVMIYFGMNQSVIYNEEKNWKMSSRSETSQENDEIAKEDVILASEKYEELNDLIINYLKSQKPYLNPEYNLQMMVDDLELSRHKLSQVINSGQKKNFYKLINGFRVEEVKEKLLDPGYEHYSILGVAMECGFNSKASFNRIFKEETNLTPTEFKKQINRK